jgi:hypothetical protein
VLLLLLLLLLLLPLVVVVQLQLQLLLLLLLLLQLLLLLSFSTRSAFATPAFFAFPFAAIQSIPSRGVVALFPAVFHGIRS